MAVGPGNGLAPGLYHYRPQEHSLALVCEAGEATRALVGAAAWATGGAVSEPQILLTIAARFQRTAWKYERMAYATILKDVGALYQTLYLVATAMGLAPCALGAGDAGLFARTAGTDPFVESSVGEFLLGRPALA